ncbi:FecR domain-containing protein [Melittangium boletus]|uniref:FecR domain-containing protein n=1 Tax=Melittangium boletus TaxID=83453 RepID=UPI003DA66474
MLVWTLVVGPVALAQTQPKDAGDDVYVVQPGDTCGTIGRKLFGDAGKGSATLHALNKMGPPPHDLKPGTVLRVRGEPDARLTFIKPEVNSKRAGKPDWFQANTGQGLWRLDSVNTLRQAGAEMTFRDLTRLQMNENALVVIYGQDTPATDTVKKAGGVELLQGELSLSLAELRGEGLGVKMPAATVATRSKDLVVGVDAQQMTRVSVFDGQAEVSARGQRVRVPRDHGTRVEKGKEPEPPRLLPEAPAWVGGTRSVRLLLDGQGVDETLAWAPVERADTYRVELARDERFNDRVHEASVPAAPAALESVARALAPGQYYARVRAVDAAGLLGRVSEVRQVEVLRVKTERGSLGPQGLQGTWPLEFSVEGAEALEARLDGRPTALPVRLEQVGVHTLELRPRGMPEARPETLSLTVSPPRVDVTLEPLAEAFQARLLVRDEQGAPLDVPATALALRGLEGTRVEPLAKQPDGALAARVLPVERDGERVASVEALWGDTPLQRREARTPAPKPPPSGVTPEAARVSVLGAPSGGRLDAAPLPTVFLPQALLVELRAQPGVEGLAEVSGARLALAVEGRVGERVALGAALRARPGQPSDPSATVAGRVWLSDLPTFRAILSFEGLWAGAGSDEDARGLWLRPALLLGGQWDRWALSTSQGYALRPGQARATWDSTYQGWFLPRPTLALGVEVGALLGATPQEKGPHAYAAGVGARWKHGGLELGASVRRGLGPRGPALWGTWSGQVTLGWSGVWALRPQ